MVRNWNKDDDLDVDSQDPDKKVKIIETEKIVILDSDGNQIVQK